METEIMEVDEIASQPGPSKRIDPEPSKKSCNLPW